MREAKGWAWAAFWSLACAMVLVVAQAGAQAGGPVDGLVDGLGGVDGEPRWLTIEPSAERVLAGGAGAGLRVVLISGDEEYRSEEALPQLAAILAERHGFACDVLFAVEPSTGLINPERRDNIPGLEKLADADLMVIATRFRDLPDEQMAHVARYVESGRPIVGIRTATHAFALSSETYKRYSWDFEGGEGVGGAERAWAQGFGRAVLGETWIAHHGEHGRQSTRGLVAPGARGHAIARGLGEPERPLVGLSGVWGPTDVYRVRLPLAEGCEAVVLGQVLDGMTADALPAGGEQNEPLMPIAWARVREVGEGGGQRVFTMTLGAAGDFVAEGSRKLFVNGVLWAVGRESMIPADGAGAGLVGEYRPTGFGFGGFVRGLRPESLRPRSARPAGADVPGGGGGEGGADASGVRLEDGDRVVLVGNTFAERLAMSGAFEALVQAGSSGRGVSVRSVPWPGDEAGLRPREMNVPAMEEWLAVYGADVVVMCFGMSESFAGEAGLAGFRESLGGLIDRVRAGRYARDASGVARASRVVLVTPIVPEDLGEPLVAGEALARRRREVRLYAGAMREVAAERGVACVDLTLIDPDGVHVNAAAGASGGERLTSNGIHPSEAGAWWYAAEMVEQLGWLPSRDLGGAASSGGAGGGVAVLENARAVAWDKFYHERLRYKPTNTEYVWGRRHEPFGVVNFPPEMAQLERMIAAREAALREVFTSAGGGVDVAAARALALRLAAEGGASGGPAVWESVPGDVYAEDAWSPPAVVPVGTETSLGSLTVRGAEAFLETFTVAPGYAVELFASELDFAELANPLAMAFDARHRLWVLCAPTYPHLMPGARPRCKLIVLEDRDGNGRADACTTFADELYIPTGFVIDTDCVYVGHGAELLRLSDTDGDGRADRREVVLSGFSMPDSHHQISAFEWDPAGGILMHEGVFGRANVETAWGTRRSVDAAVWRFDPRDGRLSLMSHASFANPWGHVFDDFGQSVLADASGGENFSFAQVLAAFEYPAKPRRAGSVLVRGRPTAGCEIISGRHFPDEAQGTFLVNQCIGFHGTRWDRLIEGGEGASAWSTQQMPTDLLESSDTNYRPVVVEIGPDGAAYILDWCNPIIGHMQYSLRDPRRDTSHGRVWRVRHATRELVRPPNIEGAGLAELLELLRLPERNTRAIARRRLQRWDADEVLTAAAAWAGKLAADEPLRERLMLELLWLHQAHGRADGAVLDAVLASADARARAAAVRVVMHWSRDGLMASSEALARLERAATDPDMRVRLEAVTACGWLAWSGQGAEASRVAERAAAMPMDAGLRAIVDETLAFLSRFGGGESAVAQRATLDGLPTDVLARLEMTPMVASVLVVRADATDELRALAADRLATESAGLGDGLGAGRGEGLLAAWRAASDRERAARVLTPMLTALDAGELAAMGDELRAMRDEPGLVGTLARALLVLGGASINEQAESSARLVELAMLMPAGSVPGEVVGRMIAAASSGEVDASMAVEAVTWHAVDAERASMAAAWLGGNVRAVAGAGLDSWSPAHALAAASLRGLASLREAGLAIEPAGLRGSALPVAASGEVMLRGREIYLDELTGCARCHGASGLGAEGFPPLASSAFVHGAVGRAAAIVVHGLEGELRMPGGGVYNSAMMPLGETMDDEQIAAVLTYVRQSFGNFAPAVLPGEVAAARRQRPAGGGTWSVRELMQRYPLSTDRLISPVAMATAGDPTPARPRGEVAANGASEASAEAEGRAAPRWVPWAAVAGVTLVSMVGVVLLVRGGVKPGK